MLSLEEFAKKLGTSLQTHLVEQEQTRRTVSLLAAGAAFESWLSFETRLLLENQREEFGLAETHTRRGYDAYVHYISNEYKKVDLSITSDDAWTHTIEFKLVYNNKNCWSQCGGIERDLWPVTDSRKHDIDPTCGRLAAVMMVGKLYRDSTGYQGLPDALDDWKDQVEQHLQRPAGRMELLWQGDPMPIVGERLLVDDPEVRHFCQLLLLRRAS